MKKIIKNTKSRVIPLTIVIMMFLSVLTGILLINPFNSPIVSAAPADWKDTGAICRKEITINSTQIPSTSTNFPICINITDTDLRDNAQSDGDDITFYMNSTGLKLNHEIELYVSGTGKLVAWVNITSLSHTTDTIIHMYYDNATASNQQNIEGTWNSDYDGVWHMNDYNSTTVLDSTYHHNNATKSTGDNATEASSPYGYGQFFDNDADWLEAGTVSNYTYFLRDNANATIEVWYNISEYNATLDSIVATAINSGHSGWYLCYYGSYGPPAANTFAGCKGATGDNAWAIYGENVTDNSWQYSYLRITGGSGGGAYMYRNGSHVGSSGLDNPLPSSGDSTYPLLIGAVAGASFYHGMIDEIRLSKIDRGVDWGITTYNSMKNATDGGFFSVGTEETSNTAPTVDYKTPVNGTTGVAISGGVTCYAYTNDTDGGTLDITWATNESGSWINKYTNASEAANGIESYTFTDFDTYSTKYWWKVYVNDSTVNVSEIYHFTTESQSLSFTVTTPSNGDYIHFNDWTLTLTGVGHTTEYNVSEDNQTASVPALNISNTGNVALNFSINWTGDPGTGISIKWNTSDNAPTHGANTIAEDPSSTQIVTNLGIGSYEQIWLWMDFVTVTAQTSSKDIKLWSEFYT